MRTSIETAMRSLLILSLWTTACAWAGEKSTNPGNEETEINGARIPKDMYAAYKELDHMLSPKIKKEMAEGGEESLAKYYLELGAWIRNNWSLRPDSGLPRWFHSRGIDNPDDRSEIILKSYRRYLRDEPLELDTIVEDYVP